MPQRETRKFLCAAVVNCNKNQKCSIDESTGNATCVCKDGFIKNPDESQKQKCIKKSAEENQNPEPDKPLSVMDKIEKDPCLINNCRTRLNEKCIATPNSSRDNFTCVCEEGFIRSEDGGFGCIQVTTKTTSKSTTTSTVDRDLEQQSDNFALTK